MSVLYLYFFQHYVSLKDILQNMQEEFKLLGEKTSQRRNSLVKKKLSLFLSYHHQYKALTDLEFTIYDSDGHPVTLHETRLCWDWVL